MTKNSLPRQYVFGAWIRDVSPVIVCLHKVTANAEVCQFWYAVSYDTGNNIQAWSGFWQGFLLRPFSGDALDVKDCLYSSSKDTTCVPACVRMQLYLRSCSHVLLRSSCPNLIDMTVLCDVC